MDVFFVFFIIALKQQLFFGTPCTKACAQNTNRTRKCSEQQQYHLTRCVAAQGEHFEGDNGYQFVDI